MTAEIRAPQISLFLDTTGTLRCEAPGANGTRRKVEGWTPATFYIEMMADLLAQRDRELERARAEKARIEAERAQTHQRIVEYTTWNYPSALRFIEDDTKSKSSGKAKAEPSSAAVARAAASIRL